MIASFVFLVLVAGLPPDTGAGPRFARDVRPILEAHCVKCHGAGNRKGGLDLRTPAAIRKGGDSGPAAVAGSVEDSLLFEQVSTRTMPPAKAPKLSDAQVATIRDWIQAGAVGEAADEKPGETFWAFRPPKRPAIPTVERADRVRTPIDAFLLAKLEAAGLTFSPDAAPETLVRRVYFDLWGLPPTIDEIDAFLADPDEGAFDRLVDRLLASPHYGERWGRHWLDAAGYADSEGVLTFDYERSAAWRYRDYVIRGVNADKPYDRFLQEQLAGDELVDYARTFRTQKELGPEVVEGLVATGYLRCAGDTSRPDFVTIKDAPGYYYQTLDDTIKIVASSTLGLTLQCARCHAHKYDPIPHEDYYRVQAIFNGAYRPDQWVPQVERRLFAASDVQLTAAKACNAKIDEALAALVKQGDDLRTTLSERLFQDRLAKLPTEIRADVQAALATADDKRTEIQKYLAGKFQTQLRPAAENLAAALLATYPEYKAKVDAFAASTRAEESKRIVFPEIRALYDLPGEAKTRIRARGDYQQLAAEVGPGVLSALEAPEPFSWIPPTKDAATSGRRLAFARWLTQPGHPLTARVLVNRLWLHHFGEGIVATADNFGTTGTPPSHPELLDWLATEFVARGWSQKAMHRLILTSTAYRQTSRPDPVAQARARQVDPDNRLLWRWRLRRLEAEALRDAVLRVAGTLNPERFGPPVPMQPQPDGEVTVPAGSAGHRRSVYLQVRRSLPLTFLQVFDQPVMETNCTRRASSTVSSQALELLNGDFLLGQAEALATRALKDDPRDPAGRAFRRAFGRPPTGAERARFWSFLAAQAERHDQAPAGMPPARRALTDLCQMLLSANEFAYVD